MQEIHWLKPGILLQKSLGRVSIFSNCFYHLCEGATGLTHAKAIYPLTFGILQGLSPEGAQK